MLFILNSENKYHRILRRGIVVGALTFFSVMIYDYIRIAPETIIPLLSVIGVMIDKFLSEQKKNGDN